MMRLFKLFSFWLTLFAIGICIINMSGYDDKNLLLFLTSPILLLLEGSSSFFKRFVSEFMLLWILYLLHVWFWCCIGLMIDSIVHRSLRKKLLSYLIRIGIVSSIIALLSVIFYTFQNSEAAITNILKNPDQYNEQSIQIAVIRSAEKGYGDNYIDEMDQILQATDHYETLNSTRYALGIIGTPHSITVLLKHDNDVNSIGHLLSMNEYTIIDMLAVNQSPDILAAGIEAANLLGFSSFVNPLMLLISNHPDEVIQEKADKVMQQIKINPQRNNPKFNID